MIVTWLSPLTLLHHTQVSLLLPVSGSSIDTITSTIWEHLPTHPLTPIYSFSLQPGFSKVLSTLSMNMISLRICSSWWGFCSFLFFPLLTLKNNGLLTASCSAHFPIFVLWPYHSCPLCLLPGLNFFDHLLFLLFFLCFLIECWCTLLLHP